MFDVGFWELCLVGLIALLVIGPERLPKAARLAGFWIGKTRNMVASVKQEIKEEFRQEEIRQAFKEQASLDEFKRLNEDVSEAARSFQDSVDEAPQTQTAAGGKRDAALNVDE